uniref:Uncharacterized protein n=1 Tax=viral metagenome TaxID=1070528 RepID=A0A6M3JRB0_9ZZZZ
MAIHSIIKIGLSTIFMTFFLTEHKKYNMYYSHEKETYKTNKKIVKAKDR